MTWICGNCTTEYEVNDPPCRKCGYEQFAKLDESRSPERIEAVAHIEWECAECEELHLRNNPPCDNCESMKYRKSDESAPNASTESTAETDSSDSDRQKMFYIGAVLGVVGVIVFPFVFFLVAMPESIYRMRDSTMQRYLPKDAKDNPAVSGTLMIFGWFGNFLWLCVALIIILVLLGLLL